MQIIILVLIAYLFMPVVGIFLLLVTGESVVAGDVTGALLFHNLNYSIIVISIVILSYLKKRKNEINFVASNKDCRSVFRAAVLMTLICIIVFMFSGYDYLIKGVNRGDIRVGFGLFGFFYKWLTIYAIPVLMLITTILFITNKKIKKKLIIYIYFMGVLSAFFTGYKFVVVYCLIPVFLIIFYKNNIIKVVFFITPIVLSILTLTTKQVMGYSNYSDAFTFIIHRMTVMSAFGTIGVWDNFKDGVSLSESIKLVYNIFGNKINEYIFGIDFNSIEVLDTNLSRKMTYLVYPSWEKAISGTTNITVTNFGEAIYIFGGLYWLYAIISGLIVAFFIKKVDYFISKGDIIKTSLYYIFTAAVILSWINSSSFFTLFSLPVFLYMFLTYVLLKFIFHTKIF